MGRRSTLVIPTQDEVINELKSSLAGALAALRQLQEIVPPRDWTTYAKAVIEYNESKGRR